MKKTLLTLFCLSVSAALWAQSGAGSSAMGFAPGEALEAPPSSNLDLLKKSISQSSSKPVSAADAADGRSPAVAVAPRSASSAAQPISAPPTLPTSPANTVAPAQPASNGQAPLSPVSAQPAVSVAPKPAVKPVASAAQRAAKPSSAKPAASKPAANKQARPAAKPVPASSTLQMPLDLKAGTVATAQVPVTAPAAKPAAKPKAAAAKRTQAKPAAKPKAAPTATEAAIENQNALLPDSAQMSQEQAAALAQRQMEQAQAQGLQTEEDLEYAARQLQELPQMPQAPAGRKILPPAAQTAMTTPPATTQRLAAFNPNDYRPGVAWDKRDSTHFTIYTQKRNNGIGSSNMGMVFESSYDTLRRFIPWMMSDKVRVFVYQDQASFLKHEPNVKGWSRALAYPTRGEIVVYDEPGKQQELKESFTHELVHIFTQKFFDKHNTNRIMTPLWLDEGLAVLMEDQAYNGMKGGPWSEDFRTLNFQRSKDSAPASFSSSTRRFGAATFTAKRKGPPLYFAPFDQFTKEDSLAYYESTNKTQDWYFQAYAMMRFLLAPNNRMQFEQFTRLLSQGEQERDPRSGFPLRGADGKPMYKPYSTEKALGRAYRYNSMTNFEDAFWRWAEAEKTRSSGM